MAAFFRFVSLIGVMSAGFYVLYLTQSRLTEPETLTESVSGKEPSVTLGPTGEQQEMSSWNTSETAPSSDEENSPADANSAEMFAASSGPAATEVVDPDSAPAAGLDFRDRPLADADNSPVGLGVVNAAVAESQQTEITLASNETPFTAKPSPRPAEADKPAALDTTDPFDAPDPFENPSPETQPETTDEEPAEFDPFGEDVKSSDPSNEKNHPPEFPRFDPQPDAPAPETPERNQQPDDKKPNPAIDEDPFSPFPDDPPPTTDADEGPRPVPEKTPVVDSDPFPPFPAETTTQNDRPPTAPKPEPVDDPFGEPVSTPDTTNEKPAQRKPEARLESPASLDNPFGDEFPELEPVDQSAPGSADSPRRSPDPFGESPRETPADISDIPGKPAEPKNDKTTAEGKAPQPDNPLDTGFDPFAAKPSAPQPAESVKPAEGPSASVVQPERDTEKTEDFPALTPPDTAEKNPAATAEENPEQPIDFPEFETPEQPKVRETLPRLDEFSELDEKLKRRAVVDDGTQEENPVVKPESDSPDSDPAPLPSFEKPAPDTPNDRDGTTSAEELRSAPTGMVPSLTDLQGDGVLSPETPRKVQLPYLEIHKSAPEKAILSQPFVYTILVKNVGEAAANEVTVQDQIPKGANLTGTIPQAELVGRRLVWKLGRIEPGEEQKVAVRVVPIESGPIGSVATVNFVAEVGAETVVEHPDVLFEMVLPEQADVGSVVECRFTIENQGKDVVTGIVLRDIIPEGLHHPAGKDLENPLGDLKPGEKISEILQMKVLKPGEHVNRAILTAEGGLEIKQEAPLEAAGNRLVILRRGPQERFVGRPAAFQNVVKNSSRESVRNAIVIEKLPTGMQFVQAGQGGQYHAAGREIYWKIPELKPGQSVTLDAQMVPLKPGVGESVVRVRESQGKEIQAVSHTQIRSYASIGLEVTEFDQPILVGDTVVMRVEATNRGNASAQTVQMRAKIPPTLQLMSVRGKTRFRVEGRDVVFETLQALPAGATEIIELELEAAAPSKAEVAVSVQSRGMSRALVKSAAVPVNSRQ